MEELDIQATVEGGRGPDPDPARPVNICRYCDADLVGAAYTNEYHSGQGVGSVPDQSSEIQYARLEWGHEEPGIYDGILYWSCPFCGGTWHRFEPGDGRRYERAKEFIHGPVSDGS